jgi:hypothetical protein
MAGRDVNKFGGMVSLRLNAVVKQLWLWCMLRDITLTVEHLPGVLKIVADEESRMMKDRLDWMANQQIFARIHTLWGPLEVDLFRIQADHSAREVLQLEARPRGRGSGCLQPGLDRAPGERVCQPFWWGEYSPELVNRGVTLVLIASVWENQPWYPALLEILPLLLPQEEDLIIPTHPESLPEVLPQLAAWHISGNATRIRQFQKRARSRSLPPGVRNHHDLMTHSSRSGCSGIVNVTPILFQVL